MCVEVDVDAVGHRFLELKPEVRALVVNGRIEAKLFREQAALRLPTGNADDAAAADAGHLADQVADRTGGRRDEDGLPLLRLTDIEQTEVGGQPVRAIDAKVVGRIAAVVATVHDAHLRRGMDRVVLPAGGTDDQRADRRRGVVRRLDPGHRGATHDDAGARRAGIARAALETGALARPDRDREGTA